MGRPRKAGNRHKCGKLVQLRRIDQTKNRAALDWRRDRKYVKSTSFDEVCLLAGVDPQYARDKLKRKMADENQKLCAD